MSVFLNAPCMFCGYNGEHYWQAQTHEEWCPWYEVGGYEERRDALHGVVVTMLERLKDTVRKLAAAEARAERLAAYARALKAYDEQLTHPTIETTTDCWQLGSAVVNAEAALQPGDLGEEGGQ